MMKHDEIFEVVEVAEPAVVAMSMSMSFVGADEDFEVVEVAEPAVVAMSASMSFVAVDEDEA